MVVIALLSKWSVWMFGFSFWAKSQIKMSLFHPLWKNVAFDHGSVTCNWKRGLSAGEGKKFNLLWVIESCCNLPASEISIIEFLSCFSLSHSPGRWRQPCRSWQSCCSRARGRRGWATHRSGSQPARSTCCGSEQGNQALRGLKIKFCAGTWGQYQNL